MIFLVQSAREYKLYTRVQTQTAIQGPRNVFRNILSVIEMSIKTPTEIIGVTDHRNYDIHIQILR